MNIDYLYSIVNLYLKKENNNKKTILSINKKDDNIEFSFNMIKDNEDKTTFVIPYEEFKVHQIEFIKLYKEELLIIDEKYSYDNATSTCYYYVLFNSGRIVSFRGFTVLEMNNIRNILYDIKINTDEVRLDSNEKKEMVYKPRLRLEQAGFSSYATLFLVVIFFLMVLVISLWVFKSFIRWVISSFFMKMCYTIIVMFMDINEKLNELFILLDNDEDIKKIKELKTKITDNEIKLINDYRKNPTVFNKEKLYDNKIINEYLISESKLNYLIMEINNKFKRRKDCACHKW